MRRAGYTKIFTPRIVVGSLFFLASWAAARELLEVTPTESRWFVGFALALVFAALARAAQLLGKEKPPKLRAVFGQAFATGLGAMGILYGASIQIPNAPNPDDSSFLAAMVAGGSIIGILGIEFFIKVAQWVADREKRKGGG